MSRSVTTQAVTTRRFRVDRMQDHVNKLRADPCRKRHQLVAPYMQCQRCNHCLLYDELTAQHRARTVELMRQAVADGHLVFGLDPVAPEQPPIVAETTDTGWRILDDPPPQPLRRPHCRCLITPTPIHPNGGIPG